MAQGSKFDLFYFSNRGRALTSQLLLSLAGADWKVSVPEWPKVKESMPYGRLPVLIETEQDGSEFVLSESRAIEEYLASTFGFLPASIKTLAVSSQYVNQIFDVIEVFASIAGFKHEISLDLGADIDGLTKNPDECKDRDQFYISQHIVNLSKILADSAKYLLQKHEQILAKSESGYYFGDSITYADLTLYSLYFSLKSYNLADEFDSPKYPHVTKLIQLVASNSAVVAVINS
ncbi:Glutathione S-transferase class-mu 28 kDa isozyme [Smittium culicis]|uniref:Glutathione S-transferase class-mu 28 kDa isozyme n=1 Tax=Smittium culicis TaxID=133412 RepID=A0A1R1YBV7_9FUNG|nr:Glutathione S-transferase class-mu 28 kDa isozyme [Smittium culicis]